MRLSHTLMVQIGQDSEFKKKLVYIEQTAAQVVSDGFEKQANSSFNIAPSGLEAMTFGDVDEVKGLYIESDSEVKVRLNGSADPIQLRKAPDAALAKFFLEADITELTIENPSTENEANGFYTVWGDVAPATP